MAYNSTNGTTRDVSDKELERLGDRELLRMTLRREKEVLNIVERLAVGQRHLQIAVDGLMDQSANLLDQQNELCDDNAALRREIATMRRIGETVPRFACFMKLPPELRFRIWDLAIPRRFVRLNMNPADDVLEEIGEGLDAKSKHLPPAVSQVCQEARAIAVRHARFRAVQHIGAPVVCHSGIATPVPYKTEWTWFDSDRDALMVPALSTWGEDPDYLNLTTAVQHVFVEDPHVGMEPFLHVLFDPKVYPNLHSVSFIVEKWMRWKHVVEAPNSVLDPDNPYHVVDIEQLGDTGEIDIGWSTKSKAYYDSEFWFLREDEYPWDGKAAGSNGITWPQLLEILPEMWQSKRKQEQLPSFRRVAMFYSNSSRHSRR